MSGSKFTTALLLLCLGAVTAVACSRHVRVESDVPGIELVRPAHHYDGWGAKKLGKTPDTIEIDTSEQKIAACTDDKIMWLRIPSGVEHFRFVWKPHEPTRVDLARLKYTAEIGMTEDEVIQVLGRPARTSTTNTGYGRHEDWIYANPYDELAMAEYIVSFKDGKVDGTHKPSR